MNRREAIKGMAAFGMLSLLPKLWQASNTYESNLHFIGLGGAGCNALEFIRKKGIKARYTCISSPVRNYLGQDINFIKYDSPKFFYSNKASLKMHLTDEINELFKPQNKYVLMAGLSGYTGTNLLRAIIDKLVELPIEFNALCSIPFNFEGPLRKNAADQMLSDFNKLENFWYFELEKLKEDKNCKTVSDAFKKADERFYKIYVKHLA